MGHTTDRNDLSLKDIGPNGQQRSYLVLPPEDEPKRYDRPLRYSYVHLKCGTVTRMSHQISETYARQPHFYGGTFCCGCGTHFPLRDGESWNFLWEPDGEPVGSDAGEAAEWNAARARDEADKHKGGGI